MKATRILLAGILGGIAMFAWTSFAHMATPLGEVGIREIPNEQAVLTAMQGSIGNAQGFYFFPGMGLGPNASQSEKRAAMSNYQQLLDKNPSGILIYKPVGARAMTFGQLGGEFGIELLEALLLAILLSMTVLRAFGSRVGFALVVGILAAITTNTSYAIWFGFPASYTLAAMFVEAVKFLVAGCVIALVMGKTASRSAATTA